MTASANLQRRGHVLHEARDLADDRRAGLRALRLVRARAAVVRVRAAVAAALGPADALEGRSAPRREPAGTLPGCRRRRPPGRGSAAPAARCRGAGSGCRLLRAGPAPSLPSGLAACWVGVPVPGVSGVTGVVRLGRRGRIDVALRLRLGVGGVALACAGRRRHPRRRPPPPSPSPFPPDGAGSGSGAGVGVARWSAGPRARRGRAGPACSAAAVASPCPFPLPFPLPLPFPVSPGSGCGFALTLSEVPLSFLAWALAIWPGALPASSTRAIVQKTANAASARAANARVS